VTSETDKDRITKDRRLLLTQNTWSWQQCRTGRRGSGHRTPIWMHYNPHEHTRTHQQFICCSEYVLTKYDDTATTMYW